MLGAKAIAVYSSTDKESTSTAGEFPSKDSAESSRKESNTMEVVRCIPQCWRQTDRASACLVGIKNQRKGISQPSRPRRITTQDSGCCPLFRVGITTDWRRQLIEKLSRLPVTVFDLQRGYDQQKCSAGIGWWQLEQTKKEADVVVLHLEPGLPCPIGLVELGLYAQSGKLVVYCPGGVINSRRVIDIYSKYGAPLANSLDELEARIRERLCGIPDSL